MNSQREWQRPHARNIFAHNVIVHSPTIIEHSHDRSCILGEIAVREQGTLDFDGKASRRLILICADHGTGVVTAEVDVAHRETQAVH